MTKERDSKLLSILNANWQAEMEGHHTYKALSDKERDPQRRNALRGLASAEKHHADLWAKRIHALGGREPAYRGKAAGEADSLANRIGGVDLALRRLEIDESRDIAKYGKQLTELGDQPSMTEIKCRAVKSPQSGETR
jgi:Mn-containing catalase